MASSQRPPENPPCSLPLCHLVDECRLAYTGWLAPRGAQGAGAMFVGYGLVLAVEWEELTGRIMARKVSYKHLMCSPKQTCIINYQVIKWLIKPRFDRLAHG